VPSPSKGNRTISIRRLLKWKRYQDEKHELFMSMMRKLELKDIEQFWHIQRIRKRCKMNSTYGEFDKHLKDSRTPEQLEGRMSNTSEGDSDVSSLPNGDSMGSSAPEEDFRMGGMHDADGRKGEAQSGDFSTGREEDSMIGSTRPSSPIEAELKNIMKEKVQKNATKITKVSACRHFIKGSCRQGEACSFEHREEDSHPDTQKVFLGGLPNSVTTAKLLQELRHQG